MVSALSGRPTAAESTMPLVVQDRLRTALIAPDGTGQVVLAFPGETLFLGPGDWSPDGRQLALQGFDPADASRAGIYHHRVRRLQHQADHDEQ